MRRALRSGLLIAILGFAGTAPGDDVTPPSDDPWFEQGQQALTRALALHPNAGRAKNVILFVGDGMGVPTVTAARILQGQLRGESGEEGQLAFEALPYLALAKTYNTNQQVPDSAGTITAMVSGVKTKAGVLGVDQDIRVGDYRSVAETRVGTLCEIAETRGMSTGAVTTARVTHATPAGCFVHSASRNWEADSSLPADAASADFPDIARQLVEFPGEGPGDGIDVLMGGGRVMFLPEGQPDPEDDGKHGTRKDGRDLAAEFASRDDSAYVWRQKEFEALDLTRTRRLLALFERSHMEFDADREEDVGGEPSLAQMTEAAIAILETNPKGYVLIVEGGRIDHAHHLTNAARALRDTLAFSDAVDAALAKVRRDETLVVVTADHGHVFSMGGYPTRGNDILGPVKGNDRAGKPKAEPEQDARGEPYTSLTYGNGPGHWGLGSTDRRLAKIRRELNTRPSDGGERPPDHLDYLQRSAVPLELETHSGEDVPIYAGGPGAALFHGVQEQHYVYHAIVQALGWNE